jgi:hypothetical protein
MPNHVTHRVRAYCPAEGRIAAFLAAVTTTRENGDRIFDFNTLIPMPPGMAETVSGSSESYALWALGEPAGGVMSEPCDPRAYPWAETQGLKTREDVLAWLKKDHPTAIPTAEKMIQLHRQTGHYNWYGWSVANWGTKWNAYQFHVVSQTEHDLEFRFDTAWSPPEPIFEKICETYPDIAFHIVCYDEGSNFSGEGSLAGGTNRFKIYEYAVPAHAAIAYDRPFDLKALLEDED